MIQLQLSNISLVLGATHIFDNLSWEIQRGQKIGLIGANGAGKSSLYKLIVGQYNAEQGGSLTRSRGLTIGYLAQTPELDFSQTALESSLDGNPRVAEVRSELMRVEDSLGDPNVYENERKLGLALDRQQNLIEEYDALGGDSYPARVEAMLTGLGLRSGDLSKPLNTLSGGQKKLVGLARLLLLHPNLLLLDEPDNHLDLPGKIYLEKLIREYDGTVVIVSHDRYLLDAVVTHIAELEDGKMSVFAGDYSTYSLDKEARLARQAELFKVQEREVGRLEAAIKRFAIWGKVYDSEKFAIKARSMQKRLDKMDRIDKPIIDRKKMDLKLKGYRGSNKVLELVDVQKAFGELSVFDGLQETIWHGERVGLIGPNGAGKSVLIRMILNEDAPDIGEIKVGPSVTIGYYAQEHETLDFEQTLLDVVRFTGNMSAEKAMALLSKYLFTYEQAQGKVSQLSGGERSRLQLALVVLSGANFLLLDEPTNNLDIASAEMLEIALEDFVGTVLIISHDRYFLDRTVERLLVIEERDLARYLGGYSEYLEAIGHG
ncbi:MAG: ABC-F family ATP-binding cassette domain-containing protein [Anaerolineae bacterium]|jgi:ATP-binding cassette subfamily F protein 3|nr:ABC-F family ATP-binding cassette domain-containing protein [Anaerolineae bacterium]MBT4311072.1 ABC-F family ATP-binding cassette domain-containing protein [Anaerolineae bacterium]MBT4457845.1 ABC-F family ATP-binding cassette domain-containing protein [Anaerolineae bacterium]MBT6061441.1 ABC-F family ATP-binding cassette domain-containing protein [Anaerolineae bacterium]MBT6812846.1 ABC-F family ATP-binding cassette domain-containing protein [Anaerolineae bacterium]